jgi:hypothetical protein
LIGDLYDALRRAKPGREMKPAEIAALGSRIDGMLGVPRG